MDGKNDEIKIYFADGRFPNECIKGKLYMVMYRDDDDSIAYRTNANRIGETAHFISAALANLMRAVKSITPKSEDGVEAVAKHIFTDALEIYDHWDACEEDKNVN